MKITQPGSYMDHLLRQTRQHHVQLSMMADAKANMMLTVPAILITLSVPHLFDPRFQWAAGTLMVFCLATILLAVCAAMPKLPVLLHHQEKPDLRSPAFNLLFFGDFTRLSYVEFEAAMEEVLNDPARAYEAQVREVYDLGLYLAHKKYFYVRLAYLTFLAGLVGSATIFLLTSLATVQPG